ncbi:hypothetical protein [Nocardioides jensenii]|uniref:hypothetical protein n=1 Tax=Nocardioides jensenii TaxID=1843 RepID=UPI000831EFBC|nr:hypothetical protein [Nocardioides jensenii]
MTTPAASPAPIASLRILTGALVASPIWIGVAIWFVLTDDPFGSPETWALAVVVAVGVAATGLILGVGFRAPAPSVSTGPDEAAAGALEAFRAGTMLRFALAETPILAGLALAFVTVEGGFLLYLIGAAIGLALMLTQVWPGDGVIARAQRVMERDGAQVPLREALYGEPSAGGTTYRS